MTSLFVIIFFRKKPNYDGWIALVFRDQYRWSAVTLQVQLPTADVDRAYTTIAPATCR